jgi:hypothetical protein
MNKTIKNENSVGVWLVGGEPQFRVDVPIKKVDEMCEMHEGGAKTIKIVSALKKSFKKDFAEVLHENVDGTVQVVVNFWNDEYGATKSIPHEEVKEIKDGSIKTEIDKEDVDAMIDALNEGIGVFQISTKISSEAIHEAIKILEDKNASIEFETTVHF